MKDEGILTEIERKEISLVERCSGSIGDVVAQ
jgi:hypothetical protein